MHSFMHACMHSFSHAFIHSINQSINQSMNHSVNQSINQSIDQSIDQSFNSVQFSSCRFNLKHFSSIFHLFSSIHSFQLASFQLTNISYKQTVSFRHVPFLKLPPQRIPGTTWCIYIYYYIFIYIFIRFCSR